MRDPERSTGGEGRGRGTAADAAGRLTNDWLGGPLGHFIRASGLLRPDQHRLDDPISLSEALGLLELIDGAPLTQRDLCEHLGLEKSTVSRLVAGLERRGLVSRHRNPENRRFHQVAITEHGRAVVSRWADAMLERHARIFAAITPEERDALTIGLAALVRAMEERPSPGPTSGRRGTRNPDPVLVRDPGRIRE